MTEYLNQLNDKQLEAVRYIDGPLLVLAGAGTGKTSVIVSKISYIIENNICDPNEILCVTFTNKAALELKHRIFNNIQYTPNWVGTFHSISAKILRQHAEIIGLDSRFLIVDAEEQLKLVKTICDDMGITKDEVNPKVILHIIQSWKDLALYPNDLRESDIKSSFHNIAKKIYIIYQQRLDQIGSVDFGDIILKNIVLFKTSPDILSVYQHRFKFIFVDEYQDTNSAQYVWLRMISPESCVCCVGDDDQSIYRWRGAKVENILKFEQDFTDSKVIKLEQNYRSTKKILEAADSIISKNTSRYKKTLWTEFESDENVVVRSFFNDREEAEFIASQVFRVVSTNSQQYSDMAVLVRASFQTRSVEEALIANSIPYKIIGGVKFYDRQEVKDVLAYIRLAYKYRDDLSLERVINKPKRGIGKATLAKIRHYASEHRMSQFEAIDEMLEYKILKGKIGIELSNFVDSIKKCNKLIDGESLKVFFDSIINESGYIEMLKNEKTTEAQTRIENINEFKQAFLEFTNLDEFLEHVSLVTALDDNSTEDSVNVMTLHAAKGLEFNTVFLPGWEEGIFPHSRTIEDDGHHGLEEERRLAYVGITRAKRRLFISYCSSRRMYNQYIQSLPSRFISDLPNQKKKKHASLFKENLSKYNATQKLKTETLASNMVSHPKFGVGYIIGSHGDTLEIKFDNYGLKKILRQYVKFI